MKNKYLMCCNAGIFINVVSSTRKPVILLIQQLLSVCNEVLNDGSSDNITVMHNSDECCYCQMKFFLSVYCSFIFCFEC